MEVARLTDERARKALAVGHVVAAVGLLCVLVSQAPYHAPMAILVALHLAISYGFLRGQPWTPWFMGVAAAMGVTLSGFTAYACVGFLGFGLEAYALLTALIIYSGFLVLSLGYVIFRRKEFSTGQSGE